MKKSADIKYNKQNEFIKYKFILELRHKGINGKRPKDPKTIKQYVKAIREFEIATAFKDFKKFSSEVAIQFKAHMEEKKNIRTGENVSKSLYIQYIGNMKEFLEWLIKASPAYSHLKKSDIEFLNTSQNDRNIALSVREKESYFLHEILATIRKMPESNEIQRRNKAMLSLALLTTPRISALQATRIESIKYYREYDAWAFEQNPKIIPTKYRRYINSFFIGSSQDIIDNVLN